MTYKLINYQFMHLLKKTVFLYTVFILLEFAAFYSVVKNLDLNYYRFEQVLEKANIGILFLLAFIGVLLCVAVSFAELYMGSKSIYSVIRLPVSPTKLCLSFYAAGTLGILILVLLQTVAIIIFSAWLPGFFPHQSGTPFTYMNDYLALAFIRSKSLSFLFPISFLQLLRSLVMLLSPTIAVLFLCMSLASKLKENIFFIGIWAFLYILLSGGIEADSLSGMSMAVVIILICLLCLCFVKYSIHAIEGRCIV